MTIAACDDTGRSRLEWPEPLILEVVRTAYDPSGHDAAADSGPQDDRTMEAVRLHARFLRALVEGQTDRAGPLRVALIACCAARHVAPAAIAAADEAAFRELTALVQSRFRNSPRLRLHFVAQLHEALGRLKARPAQAPAPQTPWLDRLWRPAAQPSLALAVSG